MKKKILLMALLILFLSTGITAYAYWTDKVDLKVETPIAYPVEIELANDKKSQTELEESHETSKPQIPSTKTQDNQKAPEMNNNAVKNNDTEESIPSLTGETNDTPDSLATQTP